MSSQVYKVQFYTKQLYPSFDILLTKINKLYPSMKKIIMMKITAFKCLSY